MNRIIIEFEAKNYINIDNSIPTEFSMVYIENNLIKDKVNLKENILEKAPELEDFINRNNIQNTIEVITDCKVLSKILFRNWVKKSNFKGKFSLDNIKEFNSFIKINDSKFDNLYEEYENHQDSLEQCYDIFKILYC